MPGASAALMVARRVLALDYGAQSGRGVVGTLEADRLSLEVVHRFDNEAVRIGGGRYWDSPALLGAARDAIAIAVREPLDSVAVDAWGVDYGLIDAAGELVTLPWSYRDERTLGAVEAVAQELHGLDLYGATGVQTMRINTLFQLWVQRRQSPWVMAAADRLLAFPDLLGYWLSGVPFNEITAASTTQLLSAQTRDWAWPLIDALELPRRIFHETVEPGALIGPLVDRPETSFVATASHDTASAVAGSLALRPGTAFISSGTWCLVGTEVKRPVISERSRAADLSNELGVDGRVRLLKNVIGLWLLGESRRYWREQGIKLSHEQMVESAEHEEPLQHVFDPDDSSLLTPGDVPRRIAQLMGLDHELEPAQATRAIIDSLALKFRWVVDQVEEASGIRMERINLVGGGSRNRALCQATADATGRLVIAGPAEATALGNIIVQLVAHGDIANIAEGRELALRGAGLRSYEPAEQHRWAEAYESFARRLRAESHGSAE